MGSEAEAEAEGGAEVRAAGAELDGGIQVELSGIGADGDADGGAKLTAEQAGLRRDDGTAGGRTGKGDIGLAVAVQSMNFEQGAGLQRTGAVVGIFTDEGLSTHTGA